MFSYAFMQHAFLAGTAVALVAGAVGWMVVLRRSAFAAHALSHIGFAGAAGASLLGVLPLWGLLAFCLGGAGFIGALGERSDDRDSVIGIVLAMALGFGVLFISLYSGNASTAYSILFGEILGVSMGDVGVTIGLSRLSLVALASLWRPLLFASVDRSVAKARGVKVGLISVAFMVLLAFAIAISVQVVGVLLIFALLVTPAATAQLLTARPLMGVAASIGFALLAVEAGLTLGYQFGYPVSFWITLIATTNYALSRLYVHLRIRHSANSRRVN